MLGLKGASDDTMRFHYDMVIFVQNTQKGNSKTRNLYHMVIFVQNTDKVIPITRLWPDKYFQEMFS